MTIRPEQFDDVGLKYEEYSSTSTFKRAERHSFLKLVGPLEGLRVLDLACGLGFYSRLIKKGGASEVLGVDVSPEMIRLAQQQEQAEPLGVRYQICNALDLPAWGPFDLISAIYLLNYAKCQDEMLAMLQRAYNNLKDEGRLIAFTINPDFKFGKGNMTKYGGTIKREIPEGDKALLEAELFTHPPTLLQYYRWNQPIYEWAIKEAGFTDFDWHPLEPAPEDLEHYGKEYWQDFYDNCLVIGLSCRK